MNYLEIFKSLIGLIMLIVLLISLGVLEVKLYRLEINKLSILMQYDDYRKLYLEHKRITFIKKNKKYFKEKGENLK